MLQYSRAKLLLLLVIQFRDLYQMQMPADFGIGLYVCVCVCGPIFQVRLNFSADDRGTKDRGEEEEGGDRLSEMCKKDNNTKYKTKLKEKLKKLERKKERTKK